MVNARKTVTSPKRSTNEAEPLVLVKVRLPQSLVSTLDAISKERGRASLERFSSVLNREGFPLARFCDSTSLLVKEADLDGSISIDGFACPAFGGGC